MMETTVEPPVVDGCGTGARLRPKAEIVGRAAAACRERRYPARRGERSRGLRQRCRQPSTGEVGGLLAREAQRDGPRPADKVVVLAQRLNQHQTAGRGVKHLPAPDVA